MSTKKTIQSTKPEVYAELIRRGKLSWLLYKHQRPIYNKIQTVLNSTNTTDNSHVLDISRQFGKSFTMFLTAVEFCLAKPFQTVVYVAPLKKQVIEIVTENTFRIIFQYATKDCIPTLKDSELSFPNGSRIRLAGTDNHNYESLRGGVAHLVLLDEAGFMSNLLTGVIPTVLPMTKTTGGKLLYASTPPETLDHDYYEVLREHDESGNISTFTIHDDKSLTQRQLDTIISACKGRDTTLFKREYECQRIAESSQQVVPELTIEVASKILLPDNNYKQDQLFGYWKKYVVADWGGKDFTAIVFAHYNYQTKKVIIEDQLNLTGDKISSARIAKEIKDKINALWPDPFSRKDMLYVCDSNNVLIQNDMNVTHGLPFVSTSKDRLAEQMVQKVRDWIYDERILFAPNAEFTLKSCMSGWWSKGRDKFAKSKIYGHYDHLAATIYLIRNIDTVHNPLPSLMGFDKHTQFIEQTPMVDLQGVNRELMQIFYNPRRGSSYR